MLDNLIKSLRIFRKYNKDAHVYVSRHGGIAICGVRPEEMTAGERTTLYVLKWEFLYEHGGYWANRSIIA